MGFFFQVEINSCLPKHRFNEVKPAAQDCVRTAVLSCSVVGSEPPWCGKKTVRNTSWPALTTPTRTAVFPALNTETQLGVLCLLVNESKGHTWACGTKRSEPPHRVQSQERQWFGEGGHLSGGGVTLGRLDLQLVCFEGRCYANKGIKW